MCHDAPTQWFRMTLLAPPIVRGGENEAGPDLQYNIQTPTVLTTGCGNDANILVVDRATGTA
jgi:hypothetical protein